MFLEYLSQGQHSKTVKQVRSDLSVSSPSLTSQFPAQFYLRSTNRLQSPLIPALVLLEKRLYLQPPCKEGVPFRVTELTPRIMFIVSRKLLTYYVPCVNDLSLYCSCLFTPLVYFLPYTVSGFTRGLTLIVTIASMPNTDQGHGHGEIFSKSILDQRMDGQLGKYMKPKEWLY